MDKKIKSIIVDAKLKKYEKLSKILKYLFVTKSKISQDKYYILGSFSIRKHRTISDLDINLDYEEFVKLENLIQEKMGYIEFYNGQIRWFFDLTKEYNELTSEKEKDFSLEAFQKKPVDGFPNKTFSLKYLRSKKAFDIDNNGHQFLNLKTLLRWKQTMNRDKDKPDIELIEKLLYKS